MSETKIDQLPVQQQYVVDDGKLDSYEKEGILIFGSIELALMAVAGVLVALTITQHWTLNSMSMTPQPASPFMHSIFQNHGYFGF